MLKKLLCFATAGVLIFNSVSAQSTRTLFPASFNASEQILSAPLHQFPAQDYSDLLAKTDGAYLVAKTIESSIGFPEAGSMTRLNNGNLVWTVNIKVDESKAIGLYFNQFTLPEGVSMYVYNQNKKQITGPFTFENNDERNVFATEGVQGEEITLELNIDASVDVNAIDLNIYKVASYFRGVEDLAYYTDEFDGYGTFAGEDDWAYNSSSKCMINAMCSNSAGYEIARNATVKEIIPAGTSAIGYCSGTMVNNTGNTAADCKRYLLTATHCEGGNHTGSHSSFGEWILCFNYQSPNCENPTVAPTSNKITGVKFIARDPYNDAAPASELDADFMLLQVTGLIPSSWNVSMTGWNRNPSHPLAYVGAKKFVYFHHPAGDIKKYSSSKIISNVDVATWGAEFVEGYGAPGSSGSGMFNNDQQLIGIASTAIYGAVPHDSCKYSSKGIFEAENTSNRVFYAKMNYSWENPSLSSPTNAQKLSPWLDPIGSGAMSVDAVSSRCEPLTNVETLAPSFNGDFNVYPNPSTDGNFQLNIKMNEASLANIQVIDINGRQVYFKDLGKLQSQIVNLNLTNLANGMYIIKISNEFGQATKKVVINK